MREILFRGRRVDNGEWVEGFYQPVNNKKSKGFIGWYETETQVIPTIRAVIPETLGQYTGMKDKNGKKIFEGDIVNVYASKEPLYHKGRNLVIKFDEYHRFVASGRLEYPLSNNYEWEVIGNIHDNPELLEVE